MFMVESERRDCLFQTVVFFVSCILVYRMEVYLENTLIFFFLTCVVVLGLTSVLMRERKFAVTGMDKIVLIYVIWKLFRYFHGLFPVDWFDVSVTVILYLFYLFARNARGFSIGMSLFISGILITCWGFMQVMGILPSGHLFFRFTGCFSNPGITGRPMCSRIAREMISATSGEGISRGRCFVPRWKGSS